MNNSTKNLEEKLGINPEKYSNDKTINDLGEYLELATSFTSTLLIFFFTSLLVFLSISLGYGIINKTYVFPIVFFISSIPVIAGISLIGFNKGLNDTVEGINGMLTYGVNLIEEIFTLAQEKNQTNNISLSEVGRFVGYYIVVPAVKMWANTKFLGGIILTLTSKGFDKINSLLEKQKDEDAYGNDDAASILKIKSVLSNTTKISSTLVKGISAVSKILSILGIVLGGIIITIVILVNGIL